MNTKICLILLACICVADATALRGSYLRELAKKSSVTARKTIVCHLVRTGAYETLQVTTLTASTYVLLGSAVYGACATGTVCKDLCVGYPSFIAIDKTCACVQDVPPQPICGQNAKLADDASRCQCLPGYEGDAVAGCTDSDECQASTTACASNQICTNTVGSHECAPIQCANPYGNPCGPNSACADTAAGYTCAATNQDGCPAGCGPNSACVGGASGFSCECGSGFYRPQKYLGCVAGP